jgi:hypothetical protein
MMDGNPNDPSRDNWGGSFEKFTPSPRVLYNRNTTLSDTVPVYSVFELHFKGPKLTIRPDSACLTMTVRATIGQHTGDGYYLGEDNYAIRYAPK